MTDHDRELGTIVTRLTEIERRLAEGDKDMRELTRTVTELVAIGLVDISIPVAPIRERRATAEPQFPRRPGTAIQPGHSDVVRPAEHKFLLNPPALPPPGQR